MIVIIRFIRLLCPRYLLKYGSIVFVSIPWRIHSLNLSTTKRGVKQWGVGCLSSVPAAGSIASRTVKLDSTPEHETGLCGSFTWKSPVNSGEKLFLAFFIAFKYWKAVLWKIYKAVFAAF